MATKQIQLRGISRTPSDRLTNDGGCAESLNVQLDNTELAPSFYPDDVTTKRGLPADLEAEKIFIHKTNLYTNAIVVIDRFVYSFVLNQQGLILELNPEELVNDITSIGNTVVIATNQRLCYLLYQSLTYSFLGSGIPKPEISFETVSNYYPDEITSLRLVSQQTENLINYIQLLDVNVWKKAIEDKKVDNNTQYVKELDGVNTNLWNGIKQKIDDAHKKKRRVAPFFVRSAVKLYDDTYYHISDPILIGAGIDGWLEIEGEKIVGRSSGTSTSITYRLKNIIESTAYLKEFNDKGWEDLIKSIDIFISTPIYVPAIGSYFTHIKETSAVINGIVDTYRYEIGLDQKNFEEELLSKSNFFKIKSFDLNHLEELKKGYNLADNYDFTYEEKLENEDQLIDEAKHREPIADSLQSYNNQLLASLSSERLIESSPLINATNIPLDSVYNSTSGPYAIAYLIETANGIYRQIGKKSGNVLLDTYEKQIGSEMGTSMYEAQPFGLLFCSDVRCKEIEIWNTGEVYSIKTKRHPFLPYAYAYWGIDKTIRDLDFRGDDVELEHFIEGSKESIEVDNKLYVSKSSNPFIFPEKSIFTFSSRILSTAIATSALSEGQAGQFPLYVFTEDGIWAMETAADGSFVTSKPLSREVCINPDSITPLDNAVVFVTAQGVMMLQGSQVVNISPNMNGRHYQIENSARTIIENQDFFCDLLPALSDNTHFFAFVKEATVAYDYAGRRLIFIKKDEKYQYIYKLDTQTWHKSAYGVNLVAPINSYPECLVQGFLTIDNPDAENIYIECEHPMESVTEYQIDIVFQDMSSNSKNILALTEPNISEKDNYAKFLTGEISRVKVNGDELLADSIIDEINYWWERENVSCGYAEISPEIDAARIYNLSTILDAAESKTPTKGVIATRPLNLGEPDVFKTITDIRVRGQYPKGAVKFILLGSNDGVTFYTINTLRGKAWKLFRIIILADLQPTDRISWIDVQYETKFTNKLR